MKRILRVMLPFAAAAALIMMIVALTGSAFAQDDGGSGPGKSSLRAPGDIRYLSGPAEGDALDIANGFIQANKAELGLSDADLSDVVVTRRFTDAHNGVTHIRLQQRYAGIGVHNAYLDVSVAADGSVINLHNGFVSGLAGAVNATEPAISAEGGVEAAAGQVGLSLAAPLTVESAPAGSDQATVLSSGGISRNAIPVRLVYQPVTDGSVRLTWESEIYTLDSQNYWVSRVDAASGKPLAGDNLVVHENWGEMYKGQGGAAAGTTGNAAAAAPDAPDEYRVYAIPVESPNHTSPLPPADARTLEVNPANSSSPFGWHDTNGAGGAEFTITQGNNVNAYRDADNNDSPDPGSQPDGGALLEFDFPIDLTMAPSAYIPAAVTNLFYWNNIIHDVLHNYGFDEASGNFQENNYGNGGAGSDYVNAEAQDGGGDCNANFFTPADGSNPRMQMYTCGIATPDRDGDLDNAVIVHEYGHGISNRLVGVSCLFNAEQAGEGWSDWYALMLTQETGDAGTDSRGMGTYLFGQPATGPGIRPAPYSTDFSVNDYTYGDIGGLAIPHGVGFVWATMTWEMTWELIGIHGFNPDIYEDWTTGGNNLAMQLVTDGLKNTPCNPGFVDARDGILQADLDLTGGDNQCAIWEAFARRGLGFSADQGSTGNTSDGTEAFDMPPGCELVDVTPSAQNICVGDDATYEVSVGTAFTPPVDLSAVGHPAGTTATFVPDPVPSVPGTSDLTIGNTGGATPGSYSIEITGDDGTVTGTATAGLDVFDTTPGAPTLTQPPNGATNVETMPTFQWNAATGGTEYFLEVATDAGFTNIVYSALEPTTSHTTTSGLNPNTLYYWRVTAMNPCGDGGTSSTFTFTTANLICSSPGIAIPDNDPAGVPDTINVGSNGTITDLDVYFDVSHTWVGDLNFVLQHVDSGTTVGPINRPGVEANPPFGCSGDNIDATINDEGTDGNAESQCDNAPAIHGDLVGGDPPSTTLMASFDGEDISGDWVLTVSDNVGADIGTLNTWCLVPTANPVGYSIDLEKTVGTDPSVCAAGDSITLPYGGGDVTYCYTVENTGQNDLTIHDLFDDQLGDILIDEPFLLAPGATMVVTQTANVALTTVNVATWTATGGETVSDMDSATVTVEPPTPVIDLDPDAVASTQAPDAVITQTLTVSNIGTGDLDWTIDELASPLAGSGVAYTPPAASTAQAGSLLDSGTANPSGTRTAGSNASPDAIILDQQPNASNGIFSDVSCDLCGGAQVVADNFSLSGTESIGEIVFWTGYFPTDTPIDPDTITVIFHNDSAGLPGTAVYTENDVAYSRVQTGVILFGVHEWMHTLTLASPVTLGPGNYWVEIYNDTGFAGFDFFWEVGNPDTVGNGLPGTAFAFTAPGSGWNFDGATEFAMQLVTVTPGGCDNPSDIPWVSVNPLTGSTPGGSSDQVSVVFDSTGLTAGNTYTGTLCVNSNDATTPEVTVPLTLTVATPTYGVVVSGDQALSGNVGTTITYTVMVTNTGNVADVYDLEVTGNLWNTTLSSPAVVVNPGQSAAVMVFVDVPSGAASGEMDHATFTATSQGDPSLSDSADLMSTALVPQSYLYLPVIVRND